MKKLLLMLVLVPLGCGGRYFNSKASLTIPIIKQSSCIETCYYYVYRTNGNCSSNNWELIGTTTYLATNYIDSTIEKGKLYSYSIEAVTQKKQYSGPSNCVTGET